MAYKFNPFTDTLDIVGSGGGTSYIDGEVEYHSNLPVTVGTPAVNSAFLVRKGEGLYFISRKPAGIWVRELNNGNLDDWKYAGTFSDLYRDANFRIINDADVSKELAFSLSGIDTATTRTLTVPNASGRIQVEGQPIGNTTPAAGTFTTLTLADGTRFLPSFFFADDTDTGFFRRGVNTLTFVTGGSSRFEVSSQGPRIASADSLSWALNNDLTGSTDLSLFRDAADTLAQRRTTNPQTFRLYNTFTDASNHERGFMRWSSNVLQIGTEAAGTGSARALELQTGGATRLTLTAAGLIQTRQGANFQLFASSASTHSVNLQAQNDGILRISNNANSDFNRLQFGGTTSSFPALKRSSTVLQSRLADDSDFCPLQGQLRIHQNAVAETPTATHTMALFDAAGTAYKVLCVAA